MKEYFYQRALWTNEFALWPRRCYISNKRIWFKKAWRGEAVWHGPDLPVSEVHWHDPKEHLMWVLQGKK
jgi:hypothetical protein